MTFLNTGRIAALAKAAKKANRLKVGIMDEYTVIITDYALFAVRQEYLPDKLKGVIAELAGFLPNRPDVMIEIQKETTRELEPREYKMWYDMLFQTGEAHMLTPVSIKDRDSKIQLIQNNDDNAIIGVKEDLLACLDKTKLDYDVEGDPQGPDIVKNNFVKYTNATTVLLLASYIFTEEAKKFVDILALERLEF